MNENGTEQPKLLEVPKKHEGVLGISRSETIGKLTAALAKAQLAFKTIKKESDNPFFKSKYSDLASLIDATRGGLAENGLAVMQFAQSNEKTVTVSTMLSHSSDEFVAHDLVMPVSKMDAHGIGSAITYGRRYSYQSILSIAGEDDDDGNAAVGLEKKELPKPPKIARPTIPPPEETPKTPTFAKQFWAAAKKNGRTEVEVREYLGSIGYESTTEVPAGQQDLALKWAQGEA